MINYQPPLRSPFLGQVPLVSAQRGLALRLPPTPHFELGRRPSLDQTFDEIAGIPKWSGDVLRVLFHGGTTWLGIKVGLESKDKWVSGIAWVLGIGNGLAGLADVISLIKRATGTHPPEPGEKAPVTTPEPVPALPGPVIPGTRSL